VHCTNRQNRYAVSPTSTINWLGRITEEPVATCHMLGTAWANERNPVWLGFGSAAEDSGSVAGSDTGSEAPVPVAPPVPVMGVTDARIAALEAENAALKETVAALRAALRAIA
jgi:hypothetical protein